MCDEDSRNSLSDNSIELAIPSEEDMKGDTKSKLFLNGHMNNNSVSNGRPISDDGAALEIVEQPQSRGFRFRYQCEGGSHGGLQGESSQRGNKTYPTVQILNYHGPARIIVSLVTDDEVPRIHAHELVGKNCKNGVCIVEMKGHDGMKASFPNLGVQHVTKRKVNDILTNRIIESMKLHRMLQSNNYKSGELEISLEAQKEAKKQAEEQAKNMSLNVARLCFQAYLMDENGTFSRMLPSVISVPIYDSKSPGAAALKICRMDKNAGCCLGGDEVFLLCDKVQKDDISVRFFEEDDEGRVKWESYGNFSPTDVHRQYAIVFKTPAYVDHQIDRPVSVNVQLKRISDSEISDPKPFTYYPQQLDKEEVGKKRKKMIYPFGGNDSYDIGGTQSFNEGSSTSTTTSGLGFSAPGGSHITTGVGHMYNPPAYDSDLDYDSDIDGSPHSRVTKTTSSDIEDDLHMPAGLSDSGDSDLSSEEDDVDGFDESKVQIDSVHAKVEKPVFPSMAPLAEALPGIEKPAGRKQVKKKSSRQEKNQGVDTKPLKTLDEKKLIQNMTYLTSEALQTYAQTGDIAQLLAVQRHLVEAPDKHGDTPLHVAVINKQATVVLQLLRALVNSRHSSVINYSNSLRQTPLHLAVITSQHHMVELLVKHGSDSSLVDRHGNTPIHLAAQRGDEQCLHTFLVSLQGLKKLETLNIMNFDGYTPLHMAVLGSHLASVKLLVSFGTNVNLPDGKSGRNALHHAVETDNLAVAGHLLLEGAAEVNIPMFDGNTALHLASGQGLLGMAALLMTAGADPNAENGDSSYAESQSEEEETGSQAKEVTTKEATESYGYTPIDFAEGDDQMLKILEGDSYSQVVHQTNLSTEESSGVMPRVESSSPYDSFKGDIGKLDACCRAKLSKILDEGIGQQNWEFLAELLGLGSLVSILKLQNSPTRALLDNFEVMHGTLLELEDALFQMKSADALAVVVDAMALDPQTPTDVVSPHMEGATGRKFINFEHSHQESGFGSMASGLVSTH